MKSGENPKSTPAPYSAVHDAAIKLQAQLLDCVRESVVATDLEGRILYWGRGAEALYGYSAAEVVGKPYRQFAGAVTTPDNNAFREEIISKGSWRGEHVQRRKDGTTFWSSTSISVVTDEQGRPTGFVGIDADITERKQTENALRESEERQRLFIEHAPASLAMFDRDMRYIAVSRRWRTDFNLGERDVIGQSHYDVFPEIGDELKFIHRRAMAGEVLKSDEDRFDRADGSVQWLKWEARPWFNQAGVIGGIVIFSEDITQRKQVEEALKRSEQKFFKAFTASPVPMAISTIDQGVYLDVNQAFLEKLGMAKGEVVGKSAVDLGFWTLEQREAVLRWAAAGHPVRNVEVLVRTKDGRVIPGLLSGDPLELDGIACWLTVFVDIAERKQTEQALADEALRRRILVEGSRDGIVVLDQDGNVFEANRKYAEMLGYTPEEVLKLHVWDWDAKVAREQILEMIRTVDEAGDHFETQHRRKDGSVFPVEISTNGAEIGGRKLVFCVCRDITERKEAEAKMKKQLSELRQWYSVTLDREERLLELKREVDQLLSRLGEKAKYGIG